MLSKSFFRLLRCSRKKKICNSPIASVYGFVQVIYLFSHCQFNLTSSIFCLLNLASRVFFFNNLQFLNVKRKLCLHLSLITLKTKTQDYFRCLRFFLKLNLLFHYINDYHSIIIIILCIYCVKSFSASLRLEKNIRLIKFVRLYDL